MVAGGRPAARLRLLRQAHHLLAVVHDGDHVVREVRHARPVREVRVLLRDRLNLGHHESSNYTFKVYGLISSSTRLPNNVFWRVYQLFSMHHNNCEIK